jgi:two-component system KDP operon response regulator KdpE
MVSPQGAVLVIDDEEHIRRFVRTGFELEGYAVREAKDASAGLRSAALEPPDLIILDLCLPDMHGTEVLARVRARSNVPVIALSGPTTTWSNHVASASCSRGHARTCGGPCRRQAKRH